MLAKGVQQLEIAAALHVSKRDASACDGVLRERGPAFDDAVADRAQEANHKLTVKMLWMEHCEAAAIGRSAYFYQTFREMFSRAVEKTEATRRIAHEPGSQGVCRLGRGIPPHGLEDEGVRDCGGAPAPGPVLGAGPRRHAAALMAGGPGPRPRGLRRGAKDARARRHRDRDRSLVRLRRAHQRGVRPLPSATGRRSPLPGSAARATRRSPGRRSTSSRNG